jgi:peroxiredoxin
LAVGVIVTQGLGCASLAGSGAAYVDYAHADQGARVITSGNDGLHADAGLINGIADPALWNQGEGWQVSWERQRLKQGWVASGYEDRISQGAAWAEVRFDRPRRINRVVIHGVDTSAVPFDPYKEGALQVRRPADLPGMWTTVGRIENRKAIVPGRGTSDVSPTTTFRFNTTEVEAVRFVVYEMAGARKSEQQSIARRYQTNTIALLEIEVTGTETMDPVAAAPPPADTRDANALLIDDLRGPGLEAPPAQDDTPVAARPTTTGADVGDGAPAFELVTLAGDILDSTDYRGKVVLLNFWATWCGPCVREIPDLIRLGNDMADQGVAVLGISVDTTGPAQVGAFVQRYGMDYPVAIADHATRAMYGGISSIPTTFVIDANGVITQKIVGSAASDNYSMFRGHVEAALAN